MTGTEEFTHARHRGPRILTTDISAVFVLWLLTTLGSCGGQGQAVSASLPMILMLPRLDFVLAQPAVAHGAESTVRIAETEEPGQPANGQSRRTARGEVPA